jgi:Rrf2 family nitric oxide-sensitive transcriptional repressor
LRLARPTAELVLGEVMRQTEPDLALVPCFGTAEAPAEGGLSHRAGLRGALGEALQVFMAVLDRYTLADLVQQRAP